MHHSTNIILLCVENFLVISAAQECQNDTVSTKRRLDNIRDVFLVLLWIEIGHILSGYILMLGQVVIGTVCDSPQLAPSEREQELDIGCSLAVEAQLFRRMVSCTHLFVFHAEALQPVDAEASPVLEPVKVGARLAEELQLHLLELTGTEGEVTRCNLVTERFTDLTDSERNFLSGSTLYVFEVYEDTLCSLRTKIYGVLRILCNTLEGFEHQVELTDIGKVMFSAGRTRNLMLLDEVLHLFLGPCVYTAAFDFNAFFLAEVFDQLVCTETLVALFTVHQRIGKSAEMTGSYPCLRVHQDRAVNTYVVRALHHEFLPPCFFHVVFQLNTERAVIPGICQAAVDFGTRIYKTSGFCYCHNFVHCLFHS